MGRLRVDHVVLLLVSSSDLISSRDPANPWNSVESQGRTLEQLEWVYNQPNPVKASLKVDKVVLREDGTVEGTVDN